PRPSASAPPSRPRVQAPPPVAAPVEEFATEDDDEIEEIAVAVEEVSIRVSEPSSDDAGESADDRVSADPETLEREATTVLRRILELMGEKAEIETARDSGLENVELNIKGDGSGLLIGRHGQTLDALEYVVNRILARKIREAGTISIDTESYRARRRRQLHRMALSKGEQAKREHVAVMLDPMPPRDRRIVHLALKDDPLVTTRSSGDGFLRSIEIVPVDERREGGGRGGRDRRPRANERERESDRDRPRDRERESEHAPPLGQQGGFKHGQKRIV
ncbi:MAG TPA: KH domain-containing protein, partial [Candidatus Binataceae bacterium]|nr:KH domain-containing protein [Candidatus Binataceae bacterium]